MAPGRKFSTSTSQRAASDRARARPASCFRSMTMERLPRLAAMYMADMRPLAGPIMRVVSPSGGSTLMTSAP